LTPDFFQIALRPRLNVALPRALRLLYIRANRSQRPNGDRPHRLLRKGAQSSIVENHALSPTSSRLTVMSCHDARKDGSIIFHLTVRRARSFQTLGGLTAT
jgi:hypothetical protein